MNATTVEPELQLRETLEDGGGERGRRLLMIVNPYATTVSDRLRNLVVYALRGSYEVDAVDTERRDHATELCREAAAEGYDAVVAFGGDGTVNEAANGLFGSDTPLTCLPGGRTNVYCRMLGIPTDVVDATEHLLSLADAWRTRLVDLGRAGDRHFLFSAGVGLDADVVHHVDAHPGLKAKLGKYYYAWVAATTFSRRYLLRPPLLEASLGDDEDGVVGATVLVQNASPYTYFGDRGVEMAEGARLDSGDLAGLVLRRTSPLDIPMISWRALSTHHRVVDHRQVLGFRDQTAVRVRSLDERPIPLQVDGDYIGAAREIEFSVAPRALRVLA
jgi:diacylglycerol kinase family enzyme